MIREYFRLRASIYRLLARPWYKESTEAFLMELRQYYPVFRSVVVDTGTLEEALALVDKATGELTSRLIDIHERAFARLFLGVGFVHKMKTIVPSESVYLSGTGLIMQDERDKVLEYYYANNVHTPNFTEPEDHLTAEMHFIALLSERAAASADTEAFELLLDTQKGFMQEHLVKWIDHVTADLYKTAAETECAGYYRGIALLTRWFVHADYQFILAMSENSTDLIGC